MSIGQAVEIQFLDIEGVLVFCVFFELPAGLSRPPDPNRFHTVHKWKEILILYNKYIYYHLMSFLNLCLQ